MSEALQSGDGEGDIGARSVVENTSILTTSACDVTEHWAWAGPEDGSTSSTLTFSR